jgi:hypothetical protein
MRVGPIVRQVLSRCTAMIHAARLVALVAVVEAIVTAERLSLTAIGRAICGKAHVKHSIKRVDRLLANVHLRSERWVLFASVAAWLLGDERRPVVLVDWTKVADGYHALVAAVPVGGRGIPIYSEVHPERRLANAGVHRRFLRSLADVLPSGCCPTIVTDAGFHSPWFREVQRLGWDFIGRIRGTAKVRRVDDGAILSKEVLYARATPIPQRIDDVRLYTHAKGDDAHLVLVRGRRRPGRRPAHRSATDGALRESHRAEGSPRITHEGDGGEGRAGPREVQRGRRASGWA